MATAAIAHDFQQFAVRPVTPNIGAEIDGINLGARLSDSAIEDIRAALLRYKVLFFRDQDITTEQHIAFGRRFGELEVHPSTPDDQQHPEIFHLRTRTDQLPEIDGRRIGANVWHSDVTWRAQPSLGSILMGRTIPEVGGDTMWADMVAAYRGLSPAMKDWVSTLTAIHDGSIFAVLAGNSRESFWENFPPQEHPVVRTHPETGERALYVNAAFTTHIKGLDKKESDWLLDHLFAQAAIPEYQVRFSWRRNSIAFWDNRSCQHYAIADYAPAARNMERVTIIGDRPYFEPDCG